MPASRSPSVYALAALLSIPITLASVAHAQPDRESVDEERAGRSRGGEYVWGDSTTDGPAATRSGPATHRFARVLGTVGAGITFRVLVYEAYEGTGLIAPAYLQLRAGYFFEGDGDIQHGIGLGIAANLMPDGLAYDNPGQINGLNAFSAWTFVPQYMLRVYFLDEVQLLARIGPAVTASVLPNVGFEVGLSPLFMLLAGFGLYADVSFSTYFTDTTHPLISIEGGVVFDYELLP